MGVCSGQFGNSAQQSRGYKWERGQPQRKDRIYFVSRLQRIGSENAVNTQKRELGRREKSVTAGFSELETARDGRNGQKGGKDSSPQFLGRTNTQPGSITPPHRDR